MALRLTRLLTVPVALAAMLVWGFLQTARAAAPAPDRAVAGFSLAGEPAAALPGVLTAAETSDQGLVLDLAMPAYHFEPGQADGRHCQALRVDGWTTPATPGAPALPGSGALAGIPLDALPRLQVLEARPVMVPGHYDLCPVEEPVLQPGRPGDLPALRGYRSARFPQAYTSDAFQPEQPVELLGDGFIRSQRVARLRFSPFQYNPASGELRYYPRLRVRLDFGLPAQAQPAAAGARVDEPGFESLLAKSLVNYDQARAWRQTTPPAEISQPSAPQVAAVRYKLLVTRSGLQQVTYQDLAAAGIDPSLINAGMLQVFYRGIEVPIQVLDGGDGAFNPGDSLLFYGRQIDTRYSGTNVYLLTWGLFPGQQMQLVDGTPGPGGDLPPSFQNNVYFEQNSLRISASPSGPGQDVWYWDILRGPGSKSFSTSLSQVDARPALTATLRGLLHSYAATPLHHTRIYVNNNLVKDAIWPPGGDLAFETTFPQADLLEGANSIKIEAPRDLGVTHTQDIELVNWFEISYQQRFVASQDRLDFGLDQAGAWNVQVSGFSTSTLALYDVTDPDQPAQLQGFQMSGGSGAYSLAFSQTVDGPRRYLALAPTAYAKVGITLDKPSYWRTPHPAVDYLIISHRDFITEMQRLADYRASQGLKVAVANVEDIYDEFNDGVTDTLAIHDFLKFAYDNWLRPAPQYVLLVGDGNFDPRNYQGFNEPNYIPPYLAQVDPWLGEVAADNRFVTVSGADQLPDMHLGRIPVKTAAEARVVVDKILNYEQNPSPGGWNSRLLFAADNADDAGNFSQFSDAVADNLIPAGYSNSKIYYGVNTTDPTLARQAIISAINQGQLLVNYVGHGAIQFWASENLFGNNSLPALANAGRLPFFLPMTCLDGYYFYSSKAGGADNSSVAESLLRASGKGSIGSFAATGFGVATGHDVMNQRFFTAVFNQYVTQVGPATSLAKIALAASGDNPDLLDTYLLFGDPALNLAVLRPQAAIQMQRISSGDLRQGKTVQYSLVYTNTGPRLATGVVITDSLPAALLNPLVTSSGAVISLRPGSRYVWDVANLAPGAGGQITITAQLALNYYGSLTNTASISALGELPPFTAKRATVVDPVYLWLYAPVVASATRP